MQGNLKLHIYLIIFFDKHMQAYTYLNAYKKKLLTSLYRLKFKSVWPIQLLGLQIPSIKNK